MKFKTPELRDQYAVLLHYKTREVCEQLSAHCKRMGWPEPLVTAVSRDISFYMQRGLKPKLFSWHFPNCAVDLRKWHYTPEQAEAVEKWLREQCQGSEWEVVTEDHGTGPHYHVAYRDFLRRRQWEQQFKQED